MEKKGWKTSEFWVALAAQIIPLLVLTGVIGQDEGAKGQAAAEGIITHIFALIAGAAPLVQYIHGRAKVKTAKEEKKSPSSRAMVLLFLALLLPLTGCDMSESTTVVEPPPLECNLPAPAALDAVVTPQGCSANSCAASFGMTTPVVRRLWSFVGGQPAQTDAAGGTVSFRVPNEFPATFSWTVRACSCDALIDPSGKSCVVMPGQITFTSL